MAYQRVEFPEYTTATLNRLLLQLTQSVHPDLRLTVVFADLPQEAVDVVFGDDGRVEFHVPLHFDSANTRDFLTNRWLCCWPMFAAVRLHHPELVGTCRLWVGDAPGGPGLAFCGNTVSHVLIPDSAFLESDGYAYLRGDARARSMAWEERSDKIFWRGASTGSREWLRLQRWQDIPRFRLCLMVRQLNRPSEYDIGLSNIVQMWVPEEVAEVNAAELVLGHVDLLEFSRYKYGIDIDGNTCSWPGLFTKLLMAVTVIKVDSAMGYRQWYYDRLIPWKNFVPLTVSMDELPEISAWLRSHPAAARDIARRGHVLADSMTMERVIADMVPRICEVVSR